ncbi:MAG: serine--tRNA ligase [Candidatus Magasanikbacteria bacterium]
MLDIKFIKENLSLVKTNCQNRGVQVDVEKILELDGRRREILKLAEILRAQRKQTSKSKPSEEEIIRMRAIGDDIKKHEAILAGVESELNELMLKVPNLTHPDSPIGGEEDFRVVYQNKAPKSFKFTPTDHETLLLKNDLIDGERGTKVSGAKFFFYKNNLVRMNRALINYGIDIVTKRGYMLMETPDVAKDLILTGVGFNPRGPETQIYSVENSDLSLVGTAEITMGGYHAGEILDLSKGAKKYVALSHCFRTEAGAYGRESKGLYRVHQFTKLEMFVFCKPEESEKYHQEILDIEKEISDGLGLFYRVIDIPTGDLGGPAYRKYDIEGWMVMKGERGSQGGFGEITSCSNCTGYQARRLNIRYRKDDGSTDFVHTLNGTAVNNSRWPLIIVETYQNEDGTISVPKVLQKYCHLKKL